MSSGNGSAVPVVEVKPVGGRQVPRLVRPAAVAAAAPAEAGVVPVAVTRVPPPAPAGEESELAAHYRRLFEAAVKNVRAELRLGTPEWAKAVLEKQNTKNRPMGRGSWHKIKAAVLRAGFEVNGETVVFDLNDVLIDGQHRLQTIADTGIPLPLLVVRGVDPSAFKTKDQGKKRNAADVLAMEGNEYASGLAATLAWVRKYEEGQIEFTRFEAIANDEALAVLGRYPDVPDSVVWANANRTRLIPPALLAFVHYLLTGIDPDAAAAFFEQVVGGIGVQKGSHVALLRRRLEDMQKMRQAPDQVAIAALVFKTWNRVRKGEPVRDVLVWRSGERFPDPVA